jgi:diguanylate cyclase (GGDEF)-like protein
VYNNWHTPFRACPSIARRWLAIGLLLGFLPTAEAASYWRFWTRADGLMESVVFGLTADSAGRILVKSGDVPSVSVLDGYQITQLTSPHTYGRFLSSPDRELWTFDAKGIEIHDATGWQAYPDPEIAQFAAASPMLRTPWFVYAYTRGPGDRMDVVPEGRRTGIIMFPDKLVEWDRATGRKKVLRLAAQSRLSRFRDIQASWDGGFWVAGEYGIAHLKKTGDALEWSEFPGPSGVHDFANPMDGRLGEVFVSASKQTGQHVLLHFAGQCVKCRNPWTEVYAGHAGLLKGWRGPDGAIWVQDERRILRINTDGSIGLDEGRVITGLTTAVVSKPDEGFWLGTTNGVARYSPPLWRTPPDLAWADGAVSAINGDNQGRVWFLSGEYLIVNDHDKWSRFRLPSGPRDTVLTDSIDVLENGDLVIRGNSLAAIIVFNPDSRRFRVVQHPEGRKIGWTAKRNAGAVWVQVMEPDGVHWRLEIFDGMDFRSGGQPEFATLRDLKTVLEARNGDIWLGATNGLGMLRDGVLHTFGVQQGFTDTGVFSAVETPGGHIALGGRDHVTEYDGKTFHVIHAIDIAESLSVGRDGWIWVGSGSGVHRYRPGQWITNTVEDGLTANEVRKAYCDPRGRVWAGTGQGVSLFYPDADPDPPVTRVVDENNLRETPPGGKVRLAFSGTDKWKYTSPDRLTYSWRIDGLEWSPFESSQFASFDGLRAGTHRFEVRAMDRNGNIDPAPPRFEFSVLLPWYLEKPFLLFAVLAAVIIFLTSRTAWRHHRKLAYQGRHDPLTGLANRTVFESSFQRAIAEARTDSTAVAMILLDLDRFKPINDSFGHVAGDLFLKEVGRRLHKLVRPQDTLARLGGDEFAIVMAAVLTRSEAESMAQRIVYALRQPYRIESYELQGSASVGVSLFPEHGDDPATLQRLADMAMYRCKAQDKDGYAIFDPDAHQLDFRISQMAGLIREGLDKEYFQLYYQPLQTRNGELMALEALVRLGSWVLREACRQMAQWGDPHLRVNVNVSTVQLIRPDFAACVRAVLAETGIDPGILTLEITETALMRSWDESRHQIEELRGLGVTIALDDFGTGYSTLSALHSLPVDYIKIDRSFVQRIDGTSDGLVLIQGIIDLVHKFGFQVVAEGVEERSQFASLKLTQCDFFQGYLLGRPEPVEKIGKILDTERERLQSETVRDPATVFA